MSDWPTYIKTRAHECIMCGHKWQARWNQIWFHLPSVTRRRKAAADYHSEQAKRFLECAINLCATSMPLSDVAKLLRDHAATLEEYR